MVHEHIDAAVAELHPSGRVVDVVELTGGVSADVFRVEVDLDKGHHSLVFRRQRTEDASGPQSGTARKEFVYLQLLSRSGLPVPEPLLLHEWPGHQESAVLMGFVGGTSRLRPNALPHGLRQMATFLSDLHSLDATELHAAGVEIVDDPWTELGAYLPDTTSSAAVGTLLTGPRIPQHNAAVALHGDYWPGNVLWDDGRLAAVIDWEDAAIGDPLADLATARLELQCAYGEAAAETFTTEYQQRRRAAGSSLDCERLPLWESYVSATSWTFMHTWRLGAEEEGRRRRLTEEFFERAAARLLQQ